MRCILDSRSAISLILLLSSALYAAPHGCKVIAGDANCTPRNANELLIESGKKTILEWDHFSIAEKETVTFQQFDQLSSVLNRVVGPESQLLGALNSNGRVFILNENGVYIGPNARIETAGFIAAAMDVLNADFLAGENLLFSSQNPNEVINLGSISCPTGDIVLLGKVVHNEGTLEAPQGTVSLAQGAQILLKPEARTYIQLPIPIESEEKLPGASIINAGAIRALRAELKSAPNPYVLAIQNKGLIEATEIQEIGGEIYLIAEGGFAEIAGELRAEKETGGTIHLLGQDICIIDDALIDSSGTHGGGTVLIGGDYQGKNPEVMNAEHLLVVPSALIKATSSQQGQGGRVICWANEVNLFYGKVEAEGGPLGGDGGFVEVSCPNRLDFNGIVSTAAPQGKMGELLLDPINVQITAAADSANVSYAAGFYSFTACAPTPALINTTNLATNLATSNVTINTCTSGGSCPTSALGCADAGNISLAAGVAFTWPNATTLTLIADNQVSIANGRSISNTSATTSFTAISITANGSSGNTAISMTGTGFLSTVNGDIVLNGSTSASNAVLITNITSSVSSSGTGNITITAVSSGGIGLNVNSLISSAGGNITINGTGTTIGIFPSTATIQTTGSGSITLNGTATAGVGVGLGFGGSDQGATISTVNGPISITGHGGGGGAQQRGGVLIADTTGTGTGSHVTASGTGSITIVGVGDDSTAPGVVIGASPNYFMTSGVNTITSASGNISITGTGGAGQPGIIVAGFNNTNSNTITSTSGTITMTGNGGSGGGDGVDLNLFSGAGMTIRSGNNISITGTSLANTSYGIKTANAGVVQATGSASLTMNGTTAAGGSLAGLLIDGTSTAVSSASGALSLTGNGGLYGILVDNSASVSTTGAGTLTGGGTGNSTNGVAITSSGSVTGGDLTLFGTASSASGTGLLLNSSTLTATGSLSLGGAGVHGVLIENGANPQATGAGDVTLTTTGGADFIIQDNGIITLSGSGDLQGSLSGDLKLLGGSGASQPAQILVGTGSVAIDSIVGNLILTGGSGNSSPAEILFNSTLQGFSVGSIGGSLTLTGGAGTNSQARIGTNSTSLTDIPITFSSITGSATLTGGSGSYALIGLGNPSASGNLTLSGDISLTATGNVVLQGSNSGTGFAQIGHVNATSHNSTLAGQIAVTTSGNISLTGGTGSSSAYALIGNGGQSTSGSLSVNTSPILLLAGGNIALSTPGSGQAQIVNISNSSTTLVADNGSLGGATTGSGILSLGANSLLQSSGNLRIYVGLCSNEIGQINAPVNGISFTPNCTSGSQYEQFGVFYPGGTYNPALAFMIYYEAAGSVSPTPIPSPTSSPVGQKLIYISGLASAQLSFMLPFYIYNYAYGLKTCACTPQECFPDPFEFEAFIFEDRLINTGFY